MSTKTQNNNPAWLKKLLKKNSAINAAELIKNYNIAEKIASEESRQNYLDHGVEIAEHLADISTNTNSLAAALCHPIVHHCQLSDHAIFEKFSKKIAKLLIGVNRMSKLDHLSQQTGQQPLNHTQADNIRKILLAIIDDVHVVPIKLCEHLIKLKNHRHETDQKKKEIAEQTKNIYAPLANRLGIGQLKWQLEDYYFHYTNPKEYKNISKELKMRRVEREDYITNIKTTLENLLKQQKVKQHEILGRPKHIYSIHKKSTKKNVSIKEIYDSLALRILTSSIHDCYKTLSAIHQSWPHLQKEFDDYIANPKPNGYRSIHTVITGPQDIYIEIQIRTFDMDEEAELGVAAHWIYKEGPGAEQSYEEKIAILRQMLDWQKDLSTKNNDLSYKEIFDDRIYVFTPNDEIKDLTQGSTPLDFAYSIHTDIGHQCRGAKVNGALVPLSYTLRTGDKVEIMMGKEKSPSRDWLNPKLSYLKASRSIQKVTRWFKQQNQKRYIKAGEALWEKHATPFKLTKIDLQKSMSRYSFKTIDDMLAAIGAGNIGIKSLIHDLSQQAKQNLQNDSLPKIQSLEQKKPASGVNINEISDMLSQLARCCKPIPGDSIIGYITKGHGVSIHKKNCRNIIGLSANKKERLLEVSWSEKTSRQKYFVDLVIFADDRPGLVRDISTVIANEKAKIFSLNYHTLKNLEQKVIETTIEISDQASLKKIIQLIAKLPKVTKVQRKNNDAETT